MEQIIQAYAQLKGVDPQEIVAQLQQMSEQEQGQALQQMQMELQQPSMQDGGWYNNNAPYFDVTRQSLPKQNPMGFDMSFTTAPIQYNGQDLQSLMGQNNAITEAVPNTESYENPAEAYNDKIRKNQFGNAMNLINSSFAPGISTETAVFNLGQSLAYDPTGKSKRSNTANTIKGIGAGGKTLLSLLRTGMAGAGYQNRMDEGFDEFNRQKDERFYNYDGSGYTPVFKEGGEKNSLWKNIRENAGSGKKPTKEMLEQEAKIKKRMQDGGVPTEEELMTGAYVGQEDNGNVKVEKGEHLIRTDGNVQEVVGQTHEGDNQGVDVQMQEGEKVISDHLKLGGKVARELKRKYDINVKADDTFATAVDKYKKQIGLAKLDEEHEETIGEIKKQTEVEDETTSSINMSFLGKELEEVESKKAPLKEELLRFTDLVFNMQEESKPKNTKQEYVEEKPYAQDGYSFSTRVAPTLEGFDTSGTSILNQDTLSGVENIQPYTGRGYGAKMADVEKTINTHKWYFDTEEKKNAFRQAVLKQGEQPEVKAFQEAYNAELANRAQKAGLPQQQVEAIKNQVGFSDSGVQRLDGKFGAFTSTRPLYNFTKRDGEVQVVEEATPNQDISVDLESLRNRAGNNFGYLKMPDQSVNPPMPIDMALKTDVRFGRLDPVRFGYEPQLQQLYNQDQATLSQIEGLSPEQFASTSAQITANSQDKALQEIARVNQLNAQEQSRADMVNLGQQDKESIAKANELLDYERRILTSLSNTRKDENAFYDYNRRLATQNFSDANTAQNLNQLFENFAINPEGVFEQNGRQFKITANGQLIDVTPKKGTTTKTTTKTGNTTTTKTTKG